MQKEHDDQLRDAAIYNAGLNNQIVELKSMLDSKPPPRDADAELEEQRIYFTELAKRLDDESMNTVKAWEAHAEELTDTIAKLEFEVNDKADFIKQQDELMEAMAREMQAQPINMAEGEDTVACHSAVEAEYAGDWSSAGCAACGAASRHRPCL